jgi:hypothetical protein
MLHGSTYSLEHNTTSYEREEQNVKRAASSTLTPPKMLVPTFVLDATPHYSPLLTNSQVVPVGLASQRHYQE